MFALFAFLALLPVGAPQEQDRGGNDPRAQTVAAPGLEVVAERGSIIENATTARTDLGHIDPIDRPSGQAVFVVRNNSSRPVSLQRFVTSCPCTSATLIQPAAELPVSLGPGAEADVSVSVDLAEQRGPITKHVWLYVDGSDTPWVQFKVTADVTPDIVAYPNHISFGRVSEGSPQTRLVHVDIDARLLAGDKRLVAVSSIPAVLVTAESEDRQTRNAHGRPSAVRTIKVSLSPAARPGPFEALISFFPATSADSAAVSLSNAVVLVDGDVVGN
jgi:hypothetical protein